MCCELPGSSGQMCQIAFSAGSTGLILFYLCLYIFRLVSSCITNNNIRMWWFLKLIATKYHSCDTECLNAVCSLCGYKNSYFRIQYSTPSRSVLGDVPMAFKLTTCKMQSHFPVDSIRLANFWHFSTFGGIHSLFRPFPPIPSGIMFNERYIKWGTTTELNCRRRRAPANGWNRILVFNTVYVGTEFVLNTFKISQRQSWWHTCVQFRCTSCCTFPFKWCFLLTNVSCFKVQL